MNRFFFCLAIWLGSIPGAALRADDARPIAGADLEFFEAKVRPLLIQHCYECHAASAQKSKGGLTLDSRAGLMAGGDSGTPIMPGDPDKSLLIQAVRYEGLQMPPKGKLSAQEIAILERWVRLGAPDPRSPAAAADARKQLDLEQARRFWAFQPLRWHALPRVTSDWPKTWVDRFVLTRIEQAGLRPVADADPATWLRRVTFDLSGLPPTIGELNEYLATDSPDADARVIDRLLAAPAFGEQWGRHWLDVARYSDSNGSDFNATYYNAWRYRDFVIASLNSDKPFDLFVRQQLAGDLMPSTDDARRTENLIATGYLMIGPKMLSERDKDKLTMDVIDEQIDSIGRAFLGLTLGCARCHDHKFDPIPTRDYYALAGILQSTRTLDGEMQQYVSDWHRCDLPQSAEDRARQQAYQRQVALLEKQLEAARAGQQATAAALSKIPGDVRGVTIDDVDAQKSGVWQESTHTPRFIGKGYVHDNQSNKGQSRITFQTRLPQTGRYQVWLSYVHGRNRAAKVPVTVRSARGVTQVFVDQTKVPSRGKLFQSVGEFDFIGDQFAIVTVSNAATTGYVMADAVQFIPVGKPLQGPQPVEQRRVAAQLEANLEKANEMVAGLQEQLKKLRNNEPKPPQAMAVCEAPSVDDCRIRIRGEHLNLGPPVERGFVRVLAPASHSVLNRTQSGRLELADWIASPENPLTARVIVNRAWQHLMGQGIVATPDNFGQLGQRPSHPKLLDRLALEFVQDDWSVKRVVRRIASSRVYRIRSSRATDSTALDPDNQLLWRKRRTRLSAESLRDGMLVASGLLDRRPSRQTMEQFGRLAVESSGKNTGNLDFNSEVVRSVHLPLIRNALPEVLLAFDVADPDLVVGRRPITNVPAQALLLMNSPFVEKCASSLARQLLETDGSDSDRIERLYLLALARRPTPGQRERAASYIKSWVRQARSSDDARHKAWTSLCRAMFASTDFRMKE